MSNHAASSCDINQLTASASDVEQYLSDFLDQRPLPTNLDQAIRYALLGGGKRLRPVLVVLCCQAVGGQQSDALAPAGAIELIHCFSLVHDDLPAMDDDDLRRGRPTLHKHTCDAMAILAGDAMNTLAFELLVKKVASQKLAASLVDELAWATNNMIAGQIYDTLPAFEQGTDDLEKLKIIHRNKTGALLRCACRMGAMVGGGDEKAINALTTYGETIGLMFQVVDDLLDVTQTTEHLGKTAKKDIVQGKLTYPAVMGLEKTRQQVAQLQSQAHQALDIIGEQASPLRELCDYMAVRSK